MDITSLASHLFWLVAVLVLGIQLLCVTSASGAETIVVRKPDKLFKNSTHLLGRDVTCENYAPQDAKFPADTWSCYNMRIGGFRLRYWYIPGFGAETACSDDKYDSKNDIAALCRHMMEAHGVVRELWTAYVNDASCNTSDTERVILKKVGATYAWETIAPGRGYVITLRCMAME